MQRARAHAHANALLRACIAPNGTLFATETLVLGNKGFAGGGSSDGSQSQGRFDM